MKTRLFGTVCAWAFIFITSPLNAATVTFNFEAEVSAVGDSSLFNLWVGNRFTGSMTYDSNTSGTPVSFPTGSGVEYMLNSAPSELFVDINSGYTFTNYQITIANDQTSLATPDMLEVRTPTTNFPGYDNVEFSMDIWSSATSTLASDALPTEPFSIDGPEIVRKVGSFVLTRNSDGVRAGVEFVLVNLSAPVPTPPALYLFGSGLIGLVGFAKKKAA